MRLQVRNEANKSIDSNRGFNRSIGPSAKKSRDKWSLVAHTVAHHQPMNQNGSKEIFGCFALKPDKQTPIKGQSRVPSRFLFSFKKSCLAMSCTWSTRSLSRGGSSCCRQTGKKITFKGWLVKCQTWYWAREWHEV